MVTRIEARARRSMRARVACVSIAIAGVALVASGCNSVFGFDHGTHSEGGLPCSESTGTKSASCDDAFLCMFGTCEKTCTADSECRSGYRCLNLSGGPGLAACASIAASCQDGCPQHTTCAPDRVCRATCTPALAAACESDQECRGGFCYGKDPSRDPPTDSGTVTDGAAGDTSSDGASD